MDPNRRTGLQLLSLSAVVGVAWGILQEYSVYLSLQTVDSHPLVFTLQLAVNWVSTALEYLVTPLAVYLLGR